MILIFDDIKEIIYLCNNIFPEKNNKTSHHNIQNYDNFIHYSLKFRINKKNKNIDDDDDDLYETIKSVKNFN